MKYCTYWIATLSYLSLVIHSANCGETTEDEGWYSNLSIVVHHNGEADPCGSIERGSISNDFIDALSASNSKYEMETRLTDGFTALLENDYSECGSDEFVRILYSYCDAGPKRTPILLDHDELVDTKVNTKPCRFYTREGLRIQNLDQLKTMAEKAILSPSQSCANPQEGEERRCDYDEETTDSVPSASLALQPEIHLYAVPAGRVFHFAPAFVGEIFHLDHMTLLPDSTKSIYLKVLSTSPKIFDIINVFTREEADSVVQRALQETSPTHKIKRSTTTDSTSSTNIYNKRTSENGFDTSGKVAMDLKRRMFELLGYDEYWNGHDDGLQVLRYNLTTAYVPHYDYLPPHDSYDFDFDSSKVGGNRYATVLLYMSDIPENGGGETVFSKIWPEGGERESQHDALKKLRESGDADRAGIQRESWEEYMVATCRSRFAVKPYSGRAVLFYSQLPNGEKDYMSEHGGCPVLEGDKWAANLWVWNTPREHYEGAPIKKRRDNVKQRVTPPSSKTAVFINSGNDKSMNDAELYYDEAKFWGKLIPGGELGSQTYEGHQWNVKVNGKVVKTWVIGKDAIQEFII